ncbi:S-layer homology domain-containing protein [Paenibacillus sp. VCA1]|uniref:S-layer homology domain-containing protein n=1 Tax=Paenibacillus sp. VCA1 TaxID=3039148 RepID=UPI0028727F92|nr:S-layer homology domain-containing protein [Paenibacillus sp. VCA1]MDR9853386.1 S-layer homology domain-containing protein [Paenibacillus sp. VCA1]
MSNKSYPIKENSIVMKVQGGEQKVMKKILTVALSTAMAFSMFASVAFGDSAVSVQDKYNSLEAKGIFNGYPDKQAHLERDMTRAEFAKVLTKLLGLKEVTGTLSYKDKGYDAKNWAVPYIEAVTAAGIMEGQDKVKQIFNYNGKVTVEEMATALVRALKLEVPANADNSASTWAKGYVQVAIDKGLIAKDINFQANATREQLVTAAYQADQIINLSVKEYKIAENGKDIEFTLTSGEVVKVTLEKALEPNKETEVKFKTSAGQEITAKVTWVVTAAQKIVSASGTNYKEVVINFDGELDQQTAENADNYKVAEFTKLESATLSSDKKSVTLLLQEDSKLSSQKTYNLKVSGVKNAGGTKTFNETVQFSAVDTQLPQVKEAKALGTKAFKVVFSEPVTQTTARNLANYKVDGKNISGHVDYTYPNIAFITTDLSVGKHTLTVQDVQDYANFKVAPVETDLTVAEDTAAPEVESVKATDLTKVEITFNESVKSISKVYHTSSSKNADYKIKDNKLILTFDKDKQLSLGENTIYVDGVTDYSGNSANRQIKVTPELDTTRPTVAGVTSEVDGDVTKITVEFSKDVNATDIANRENFTLKKENGDIFSGKGFDTKGHPVNVPQFAVSKYNNEKLKNKVVLTTIGKLPSGKYTLEVAGVRDNTAIGNTIVPQSVSFTATEAGNIELNSAWYTIDEDNNYVVNVQFNKPVVTTGSGNALDVNKYNYVVGSTYYPFPSTSTEIKLYSSNTVQLTVPRKDVKVDFDAGNVSIRAINISDADGNFVSDKTVSLKDRKASRIEVDKDSVQATAKNKVVADFKGELTRLYASDFEFTIGGKTYNSSDFSATIVNASAGKTSVEFKFYNDVIPANSGVTLKTVAQNDIRSVDGYGRTLEAIVSAPVADKIAPELYTANNANPLSASIGTSTVGGATYYEAELTFVENVKVFYTSAAFKVAVNGNYADTVGARVDGNKLYVQFKSDVKVGDIRNLEVYLNGNANGKFVVDEAGNAAEDFRTSVTR